MLNLQKIMSMAEENNMLLVDGMDKAIIGIASRSNSEDVLAYSVTAIIDILKQRDRMSTQEALEYYYYNIENSWAGLKTPIFIHELV